MKIGLSIILTFFCFALTYGQAISLLKISSDSNHIVTQGDKPFFWLGGTAWEMIHRLDRNEVDKYLTDRAEKGFTVIQTVILAELDGLTTPNAYGHKPLINNDPTKLNEQYFTHVDYILNKAEELGLYIGLLPTWGDKFNLKWGSGPEIFDARNAKIYGELLAKRYLSQNNIIWILGGDRIPEDESHFEIIRAMAKGISEIDNKHLITYHPSGSSIASDYLDDEWLDVNMYQSGHSRLAKEYSFVTKAKYSSVARPIINGEARYENIPDRFWEKKDYGWLDDVDVRVSAYWSMLAGAAGYTYGCNDIWQMYDIKREPTISARTGWQEALNLPGSSHLGYMKEIFETFDWQKMTFKPSLILNDNPEDESYVISAIGKESDFILTYIPNGKPVTVDLSQMDSEKIAAYWFNPRSARMKHIGDFNSEASHEFSPWAQGRGSDFLLILVNQESTYDFSRFLKGN